MGAGCLLIRLDPNVPEFNVLLGLALKADDAFGVLRIFGVVDGLAVEFYEEVVAFGGDVELVPLVWFDLCGLPIPNLEFVAGDMGLACFLGAEEDAAINCGGAAKFELELEVLVSSIGGDPARSCAAAEDRAVFDFPIAGTGRGEGGAGFPAVKGFAVEKCLPTLGVHFARDGS